MLQEQQQATLPNIPGAAPYPFVTGMTEMPESFLYPQKEEIEPEEESYEEEDTEYPEESEQPIADEDAIEDDDSEPDENSLRRQLDSSRPKDQIQSAIQEQMGQASGTVSDLMRLNPFHPVYRRITIGVLATITRLVLMYFGGSEVIAKIQLGVKSAGPIAGYVPGKTGEEKVDTLLVLTLIFSLTFQFIIMFAPMIAIVLAVFSVIGVISAP